MVKGVVLFEVRTEFLNITNTTVVFKGLNFYETTRRNVPQDSHILCSLYFT
jgi:hypothetical protein